MVFNAAVAASKVVGLAVPVVPREPRLNVAKPFTRIVKRNRKWPLDPNLLMASVQKCKLTRITEKSCDRGSWVIEKTRPEDRCGRRLAIRVGRWWPKVSDGGLGGGGPRLAMGGWVVVGQG